MLFSKSLTAVAIAASLITLSGCKTEEERSKLSVAITDAPVDSATAVYVEFTGVELKPAEGAVIQFDFDTPRKINLLALQDGRHELLLDNEEIDAGTYNWMRLKVNAQQFVTDSYIEFEDGTMSSLYVPSGSQSGLKLVRGFDVAVGQSTNFTIDFDLRKSIVNPASSQVDYKLKPALRIVDNTQVGEIQGAVANITMETQTCFDNGAAIYIYEGHNVAADDLGSNIEPLSSANVNYDSSLNTYNYTAAYLSPGDYTLAITCEAANDDPELDDEITFLELTNTAVETDSTTTVNFN